MKKLLVMSSCMIQSIIGMRADERCLLYFNHKNEKTAYNLEIQEVVYEYYNRLLIMSSLLHCWKLNGKKYDESFTDIFVKHESDRNVLGQLAALKNKTAQDALTRIHFGHPINNTISDLRLSISY